MDNKVTGIMLVWNNLNTLRQSVKRMAKEMKVIVIDNDSKDGTGLWFADHPIENVEYVKLERNFGVSAKNFGIDMCKTPYFFLIDGDSLYVPGTIEEYKKVMDREDCGCVGHCIPETRFKEGIGTSDYNKADKTMTKGDLYTGYKQAWGGYGLFRKCKARFPFDPPFNEPGWGIEDSWYLMEMNELGLKAYFMNTPLYYHEHHSSLKHLKETREKERMAAFEKRWGKWTPDTSYKKI